MNDTPDYHEGFSKGYHSVPCDGARSADFRAGWLDGAAAIERYNRVLSQGCDCDC